MVGSEGLAEVVRRELQLPGLSVRASDKSVAELLHPDF